MVKYDKEILINIAKQYKDNYNDFFKSSDIQELLEQNKFEDLYRKWNGTCRTLTALFLLSDDTFIYKMHELPNQMFYNLPIIEITIPENIKHIMTGSDSGWFDNIPGENMFCNCHELKQINFDMIEPLVFDLFGVNTEIELRELIFGFGDIRMDVKINYLRGFVV